MSVQKLVAQIRASAHPVVIFDEDGTIVYGFDLLREIAAGEEARAVLTIRGVPKPDVPEVVLAATQRDVERGR